MDSMVACGKEYRVIRLLGHGKGGYSYLAEADGSYVVLKRIHHEPCDYYTFGNKIEAEKRDYERLRKAGIRIPALIAIDSEVEMVVKEYIAGDTVFDLVRGGGSADPYLSQVREMAALAKAAIRDEGEPETSDAVYAALLRVADKMGVINPFRDQEQFFLIYQGSITV